MNLTYVIILVTVLIIAPFVLKLASSQKKETKQQLKFILLFMLSAQIALGFLSWENFTPPNFLLGFFFIISAFQVILLITNKSFNTLVVVLNFINTILIFGGMIRLSNMLGYQVVRLPSIGAVFLVLVGNVVGLAFINKDKNILKKYPFLG